MIVNGYGIVPRAKLRGADLRHANLSGAYLRHADLRFANLSGADLRHANLSGAYLSGADLRHANLRSADLSGADLRGADLKGASLNWQNHELISEVLRQAAGIDVQKRSLAGLILVSLDWCWDKWSALEHPEREWALNTLRQYVKEGDDAPEILS